MPWLARKRFTSASTAFWVPWSAATAGAAKGRLSAAPSMALRRRPVGALEDNAAGDGRGRQAGMCSMRQRYARPGCGANTDRAPRRAVQNRQTMPALIR